jgi:hypothetical protein
MSDVTIGAPPPAPSAPAGVQQPAAAPAQPSRRRLSDMEVGLEQFNARADTRAVETEQRLAKPDPRQAPAELEQELPALPQAEPDGELEPELPEQQVDQAALQAKDKELLDATKAWLEGGETPDAFKNAIHEWTDKKTGAPRRMTLGEMEEGVLRQSDYQRNMNELRGYHQQVQFREQANNQFWQAAREPEKLLEELEDRGYHEVFEKAAVTFAQRRARMKQVAEGAGYALMQQYGYPANHPDVINAVRASMQSQQQARQIEIENRKLQKHNQMLSQVRQQQESQAQRQQRVQGLGASIAPLIPTAFKSVGVRNTATNQESFWKHLNSLTASQPNWDGNVRRAHCVEAAKMVREELEDLAHARAPKRPAQQSKAMAPSKLSSSGSAQAPANDRKRVSDMQNDGRFGFG